VKDGGLGKREKERDRVVVKKSVGRNVGICYIEKKN